VSDAFVTGYQIGLVTGLLLAYLMTQSVARKITRRVL
jgi:hypothetical protein